MTNHRYSRINILSAILLLAGIVFSTAVFAANEDNVGGFAWSENIGWISFNDDAIDGAPAPDPGDPSNKEYGVSINENTGVISGYAWSGDTANPGALEGIGWISFNAADTTGCNGCSGDSCIPKVNLTADVNGKRAVTGWARAISACKDNLWNGSNCTGGGAGDLAGGWDGCLKFKDSYIDSEGDFYGWMSSSADLNNGVIGWVNLNSVNCTGAVCTANTAYKVHTSANFAPVPDMECGGSCTGGYCDSTDDSTWELFAPTGDCFQCAFTVLNNSIGDNCTKWEVVDGGGNIVYESGPWPGGQALTFDGSIPEGNYRLILRVSNLAPTVSGNSNCAKAGTFAEKVHRIKIKKDINADFMCTIDDVEAVDSGEDPGAIDSLNWLDCESEDFKGKVMKGQKIFVADKVSLEKHSVKSGGASHITGRSWSFIVDKKNIDGGDDLISSFTVGKKNENIKLSVSDDIGRSNCKIIDFNGKTLPKWQEINPVSMIVDGLYANFSKLFTAFAY